MPIDPPLVVSHRTNMGTMPENTLAGIDAAIHDGADGVEIDVRMTRDGALVLMHDATLQRTTGDPRAVAEMSVRELAMLRVGAPQAAAGPQPVPTLREAFARAGDRVIVVVEIKQPGIEAAVCSAIREASAEDRCWIWAFEPSVCVAARSQLSAVPVSLLWSAASAERFGVEDPVERAASLELAGVSLHHSAVDERTVQRAHARALRTVAWTVDEPTDVVRVCRAGVDAICGNDPTAVRWQIAQA